MPEFLANPASCHAMIGSLGITEKYLQHSYGGGDDDAATITVRDLEFGIEVVLGMSMLFVYTFRDQLRLNYCFNDGSEEPSNIQTYLDQTLRVLVEELLG
ncbi:hypothetical protein UA08_02478 [Talaromyces atroroseus]|uniref:Condensation domain-containing protein n=1 Tax=Talaromyces atroroseus TaxID=1441469 RepID=A0A225AKW7_TALAT|nr:hypothetical protein UA08_02478 [Talaromyces atroroseus]OKL62182.1 hypothetical protein UA08_02478 [Talaromyces atroroseus]